MSFLVSTTYILFPDDEDNRLFFKEILQGLSLSFQLISDIKRNEKLNHVPVIILCTSFESEAMKILYKKNAHCCIGKSARFAGLKGMIFHAVIPVVKPNFFPACIERFVQSYEFYCNENK